MHAPTLALLTATAVLLPRACDPGEGFPPPEPPPPTQVTNPVSWQTETVALTADDFWIEVDGQRFTGRGGDVEVHSDPGWNTYTTLEITFFERSKEMRLNVYLENDGTTWYADEIRSYDGKNPAEWIFYLDHHFAKPLGQPFTGNFEIHSNGSADQSKGTLHFTNLKLLPKFSTTPRPF